MIDSAGTTVDWQRHPGDICVLPVGSVEQHDAHLPLLSDALSVEYFARMVAEDLDAALLPTQVYGNCLEHSGFRGSVSLRPETLMQVVRDIADEMERQGFRIMILMNGHGGNFGLLPVARDINRMDRRLKILLVSYWEFSDPAVIKSPHAAQEIHAGEWETSVMLAILAKHVRPGAVDMPQVKGEQNPLVREDLTTFGTGHFNPAGAMGFPVRASRAKGRAIVESVRRNMLPHIRDRVARLRRESRYAGMGGLAVRPLAATDLEACMRLKNAARWNQVADDWRLVMRLNPGGCFGAVQNGNLVGTAVVVEYGRALSWIGMVLVDPDWRRNGIGRRLMEAAIERAKARTRVVMLDAAPPGRPLYLKLGFRDGGLLVRLTGVARSGARVADVGPARDADMPAILAMDRKAFGCDRRALLEALRRRRPDLALVRRAGGRVVAFGFGRNGMDCDQIGPVVAETPADASAIVQTALSALNGMPVMLDVPEEQVEFMRWAQGAGLGVQRAFTRMCLGRGGAPGQSGLRFAAAGPEFG